MLAILQDFLFLFVIFLDHCLTRTRTNKYWGIIQTELLNAV